MSDIGTLGPMATPSPANLRAFVRRHTRLVTLDDLPGIRLHVADDVVDVWSRARAALATPDAPVPFWAFAWSGGLAVARYILDHPAEVRGRRVLDLGTGSGLCAIAAVKAGASSVLAADVDPLAIAAAEVNARANGVRFALRRDDLLVSLPPEADVILAGDVSYEETMGRRMAEWLAGAARIGIRVLIGDPGRRYLPAGLERVASYRVTTNREIESAAVTAAAVYTFV